MRHIKSKSENLICVLLSIAPILFLAIVYFKITAFPNIKIASQSGIIVSSRDFVYVTIFISTLAYYASYILTQKLNALDRLGSGLRIIINAAFSFLVILLIYFNMV